MKTITRKDIGVSLLIATLGALVTQWFWLACEAFPPPTIKEDGTLSHMICDDRPFVLTFGWYTTSKVLLFVFSFAYTFMVALFSRWLRRSTVSLASDAIVGSQEKDK